jgi:RNA polymerase sigma-70 factor (ECF subfamily)
MGRFTPSDSAHTELLERFLVAATTGDLATLSELLAEDVAAYNDGGGNVRAALRPITGRDKVLAFIAGLLSRYPGGANGIGEANGQPAAWTNLAGGRQLVLLDVRGAHIRSIFVVLNPDKLTRVHAVVPGRP